MSNDPEKDKQIEAHLNFDSLDAAEKMTGKSYKDDEETSKLGLFIQMQHSQQKKKLLQSTSDLYYGCPFKDAIILALDLGFTPIWNKVYDYQGQYDEEMRTEEFVIMYHPNGYLASFSSYSGFGEKEPSLNTANMVFQIESQSYFHWCRDNDTSLSSSRKPLLIEGDPDKLVHHLFDMDIREGFKHKFEKLEAMKLVMPEWTVSDRLYLLVPYLEYDKNQCNDFGAIDWDKRMQEKIDAFPKEIVEKFALNKSLS